MAHLDRDTETPRPRRIRLWPRKDQLWTGLHIWLVLAGLPALIAAEQELSPAGGSEADRATHTAAVDAWHAARVERLTAPDGWLTLIGLHELTPGTHLLGAATKCEILVDAAVPPVIGELRCSARDVVLVPAPGVEASTDGEPVPVGMPVTMVSDASGAPTLVAVGTVSFHVIARGDRRFLRVKDSASAVRRDFTGVERFPVQTSWRVVARLEPHDPPRTLDITNVLGQVESEATPGKLVFELGSRRRTLTPIGTPEGPLIIVFADETSGVSTYGGGRFLVTDPPGPDGRVVLDFNRATNPPCAFTPYATCPLPPPENVLPIAVTAGEKAWGKYH